MKDMWSSRDMSMNSLMNWHWNRNVRGWSSIMVCMRSRMRNVCRNMCRMGMGWNVMIMKVMMIRSRMRMMIVVIVVNFVIMSFAFVKNFCSISIFICDINYSL